MTELCREASIALDEPLLGTASVVRRWILVERDGPWGAVALRKSRFDVDTQSKIQQLGKQTSARVLLIRRPPKRSQAGVRVMCAYTSPTRRWLEEFRFDSIDELFNLDLSPLKRGDSVGGTRLRDSRFFVCTHGKHDPCCAKFGRPVAAALTQDFPERTWETSHIGGDRFAGNMLVLPLGIYYGRVEPTEAATLMSQLDLGRLSLDHYRGQSAFPFAVQAAEWWARKEHQWLELEDLSFVDHQTSDRANNETRTTFETKSGKRVEVELTMNQDPARALTCRAARASSPPRYLLRSVTVTPAP